ncbi:MAG: DUF4338 domain-containing protein [Deltaproteobacteria bacterium]|nr:DUF4338 domain-containing protein [Deltaproteobacteria bacterium]
MSIMNIASPKKSRTFEIKLDLSSRRGPSPFNDPLTGRQASMLPDDSFSSSLAELQPITLAVVNKTEDECLWDELIKKHHYPGFKAMIGQYIKCLAWSEDRPLAAQVLAFDQGGAQPLLTGAPHQGQTWRGGSRIGRPTSKPG